MSFFWFRNATVGRRSLFFGFGTLTSSTALAEATGVALAPGDDFDSVAGSRSVRLSLAVGADRTAEAIDRILDFMG